MKKLFGFYRKNQGNLILIFRIYFFDYRKGLGKATHEALLCKAQNFLLHSSQLKSNLKPFASPYGKNG